MSPGALWVVGVAGLEEEKVEEEEGKEEEDDEEGEEEKGEREEREGGVGRRGRTGTSRSLLLPSVSGTACAELCHPHPSHDGVRVSPRQWSEAPALCGVGGAAYSLGRLWVGHLHRSRYLAVHTAPEGTILHRPPGACWQALFRQGGNEELPACGICGFLMLILIHFSFRFIFFMTP